MKTISKTALKAIFSLPFFSLPSIFISDIFSTQMKGQLLLLRNLRRILIKKNTQIAYVGFGVRYNGIIVNSPVNALKGNFRSKMGEQLYGGKA